MSIKSTIDSLRLYKKLYNQNDPAVVQRNEHLIIQMLSDQKFYLDLIDVYVKYYVHPNQKKSSSLDRKKFYIYSKLLEFHFFNQSIRNANHYETLTKYTDKNKEFIGSVLAIPHLWMGNPDAAFITVQILNEQAEEYYLKSLEDVTIGAAIHVLAKYKNFERRESELDTNNGQVINSHSLFDLLVLYRVTIHPDYVYMPLKDEFFKHLGIIDYKERQDIIPYFNELIEGVRTGSVSYQTAMKLSKCKSKEEFISHVKGREKVITDKN